MKIYNLLPAADNTFVFLALVSIGSDRLVHVNKDGEILFEYKFSKPVDSITMIDNHTVVVL